MLLVSSGRLAPPTCHDITAGHQRETSPVVKSRDNDHRDQTVDTNTKSKRSLDELMLMALLALH